MKRQMVTTDWIHVIAGAFILGSLALAHVLEQADLSAVSWLWFAGFVGLNLFQFGFTGFCPMELILKKLGVEAR